MNSQILPVDKCLTDTTGNSADADLKACAFWYQFSDLLTDPALMLLNRSRRQVQERNIIFDDGIHFRNMKCRLSINAGHVSIDFHDQSFGLACRGSAVVVICPEGKISMEVHWGHGSKKRVGMNTVYEEAGSLAE